MGTRRLLLQLPRLLLQPPLQLLLGLPCFCLCSIQLLLPVLLSTLQLLLRICQLALPL